MSDNIVSQSQEEEETTFDPYDRALHARWFEELHATLAAEKFRFADQPAVWEAVAAGWDSPAAPLVGPPVTGEGVVDGKSIDRWIAADAAARPAARIVLPGERRSRVAAG